MKLLFANPVFHAGHNVTCRKPSKKYGELTIGAEVELADLDGNVKETARVTAVAMFADVYDIHQDFLVEEHDPMCRWPEGLRDELVRVYKDHGGWVQGRDQIIVVQFWIPEG